MLMANIIWNIIWQLFHLDQLYEHHSLAMIPAHYWMINLVHKLSSWAVRSVRIWHPFITWGRIFWKHPNNCKWSWNKMYKDVGIVKPLLTDNGYMTYCTKLFVIDYGDKDNLFNNTYNYVFPWPLCRLYSRQLGMKCNYWLLINLTNLFTLMVNTYRCGCRVVCLL